MFWLYLEHILLYWPFEFRKVGKLHLTSIVAYILPMHSFLFMHWRRLKSCTPAKKPLCDWSIRWARLSLVEGSAFPGCLANVAACLNSCFMHTNFHTNLRKTSPPHHYIIITSTWYQPFEATISAQVHHNYFPNYQPGGAFTFDRSRLVNSSPKWFIFKRFFSEFLCQSLIISKSIKLSLFSVVSYVHYHPMERLS